MTIILWSGEGNREKSRWRIVSGCQVDDCFIALLHSSVVKFDCSDWCD
jgi:hypothetical protein